MWLNKGKVYAGEEFRRIMSLPKRHWDQAEIDQLVHLLTKDLSQPGNTSKLFPIQALALADGFMNKGLLLQARTGAGKTLISLLSPALCEAQRPLLVVPASARPKTLKEMKEYSNNWKIHPHIRVVSYNFLSVEANADFLASYDPDFVFCDEAHSLRARTSARSRRFFRWARVAKSYGAQFWFASGSLTKNQFLDFSHLSELALGEGSPIPRGKELELWSRAIDSKTDDWSRPEPGVLVQLSGGSTQLDNIRQGFRKRLVATPGVIVSARTPLEIDLQIKTDDKIDCPEMRNAVKTLRATETMPDGDVIEEKVVMWSKIRQLASGFWYKMDPAPPEEWMEARVEWFRFVRDILKQQKEGLDSPLQVANTFADSKLLARWRNVKDEYDPEKNKKDVWISDAVLDYACDWIEDNGGIVWTEHRAFGNKMAARGYKYYGAGPNDDVNILHDKGPFVASIKAHGTGKNLQYYRDCALVVSPPASGPMWEQVLGRLRRPGQKSKLVRYDVLTHFQELQDGIDNAIGDAVYADATLGSPQHLVDAEFI